MLFEVDEGSANFLGGHKITPEHFELRSPEDEPNVPAGHALQVASPDNEYVPSRHAPEHCSVDPTPYLPAAHLPEHSSESPVPNRPGKHGPEHWSVTPVP